MSLFKEKDDYIKKAFQDIFCKDSDSEDGELQPTAKKSKFEEREPSVDNQVSSNNLTTLDDDDDVEEEKKEEEEEEKSSHTDSGYKGSETVVCIDISDDSGNEVRTNPIPNRRRYRTRSKKVTNQSARPEIIQLSSDEESTSPIRAHHQVRQDSCEKQSLEKRQQHHHKDHQSSPDHFFNLKVQVSGSIKTFRTTNHQKLSKILEELLQQVQARGHTLVVTLDDKPISLEETPHSLNLSFTDKLHAIEVSPLEERGDSDPKLPTTPPKALNEIKVKLQDGNLRHTKEFRICKDQTVDYLKRLYAKEFNIINLEGIKLWFDGELIDEGLTPEELDIEDDCVLDVMIHN